MVQALTGPAARTQASSGGGRNPAWSADGRTLYYVDITQPGRPGSAIFAVDIATAGALAAGTPRELFRRPDGQGCAFVRCYDVGDGTRFLLHDASAEKRESVTRMDLVLNWTSTLGKGR